MLNRSREELRVPDTPARPTLLQRAVLWILHALMFYVVAVYPVLLMARFQPDDVVHYGFLRWIAVVLVLYWAALQLFFTDRPVDTRPGRQTLAVTAGILLVLGAFTPIVSFPFVGDVDFFREGYGDGYILLAMAGLSVALAVTGRWKQVLVPGLGSLAVGVWTFLGVQDTIAQARSGAQATLAGNPHEGLAASVMQSIQWEWGWLLLFAGSGLLVYSAARRDELEAAAPPFVPAPVEEPEVAPTAAPAEATVEEPASVADEVAVEEPVSVADEEPAAQAAASGEAEAAGEKGPDAPADETREPEPAAEAAAAAPAAEAATEQPEEATTETAAAEGPAAADETREPEPRAEALRTASGDAEVPAADAPAPAVEPEAAAPAAEPGDAAAGTGTEASEPEPPSAGDEPESAGASAEAAPEALGAPADSGGQASADASGGSDQAAAATTQAAPARSATGESDESSGPDSAPASAAKQE